MKRNFVYQKNKRATENIPLASPEGKIKKTQLLDRKIIETDAGRNRVFVKLVRILANQ